MTERSLEGRTALVTGAGQGIGRGAALALAKAGASVVVAGRTESKCIAVAEEINQLGLSAEPVRLDVTSRDDIEAAVAHTVDRFGGLNILVNNAQSSAQGAVADITDADVSLCWESGALATLHAMQAALPHLRVDGGAVINFGSSSAMDGASGFGAYAMAKEAIRGLSRVAAREWGRFGITVNVVVPNALSPSAAEFRQAQPERFERMLKGIPLGRVGDPEDDIGRAVVAIAGGDLNYMSGQTLRLTGGA